MLLPEEKCGRAISYLWMLGLWLAPFCFLGEQWAFGALAFLGVRVVYFCINYCLIELLEVDIDGRLQNRVSNLRLLWLYTFCISGFFGVIYASGQAWALGFILMLLFFVLLKTITKIPFASDSEKEHWQPLNVGKDIPILGVGDILMVAGIPIGIYLCFIGGVVFSGGFNRHLVIVNALLWAVVFTAIFVMMFWKHPRVYSRNKKTILMVLLCTILFGFYLSFLLDTSIRGNQPNVINTDREPNDERPNRLLNN